MTGVQTCALPIYIVQFGISNIVHVITEDLSAIRTTERKKTHILIDGIIHDTGRGRSDSSTPIEAIWDTTIIKTSENVKPSIPGYQ